MEQRLTNIGCKIRQASFRNKQLGWQGPNSILLGLFLMVLSITINTNLVTAQTLRYPANVNPVLGIPYSLFLNDYSTPGGNQLSATVIFNDFNEAQWDFKLRLTIESSDIRLTTSPTYIPNAPISVIPGSPVVISGEDWAPYLNYNNMVIEGNYRNELFKTGRLPEGYYNFCLEVLDYNSGEVLSRQSCTSAWLQLTDPPVINTPYCGGAIDVTTIQIPITWQLFNTTSANATSGTSYQLTLWEITKRDADPLSAVANGEALQVYQSGILTNPSLLYGPAEPALEEGKHYVFRVQAFDPEGRDSFKNNGYSQYCDFYYGWPVNGQIDLIAPKYKGVFKSRDVPVFKWSNVDNMLSGQLISYKMEVAEIREGVDEPDEVLDFAELWYDYEKEANDVNSDKGHVMQKLPEKEKVYAWKVVAYSNGREVGKSAPSVFYGPGLIERFYAGTHMVWVDAITNANLESFDGSGRIRLTSDPDVWTEVDFKGLKIKESSGFYLLEEGEFYYEPTEPLVVALSPDESINEEAYFNIEKYKIDKTGIYTYGATEWSVPFPTLDEEKAYVVSEKKYLNFNAYKVNGVVELGEDQHFDLLDPYDFEVTLDEASQIYVNDDEYRFIFSGKVALPAKVKGTVNDEIELLFQDMVQMQYIEMTDIQMINHLSMLNGARLDLIPTSYTLDFSDNTSPGKHTSDPSWKGVYFDTYDIKYNDNIDESGQLKFESTFDISYTQGVNAKNSAWVTAGGFNFHMDQKIEEGSQCYFNMFPADINSIKLDVIDNLVQNDCELLGEMYIPIASEAEKFAFTVPIAGTGFRTGYLDEGLDDTYYEFNKDGGDQRVNITIKRAVFADNNRLNMTIDMEWPSIDIKLENIAGFKAWGDYNIGFNVKNGSLPLTNRVKTLMKTYEADAHTIGAGASEGNYSFAIALDLQLGSDVAGDGGPPSVNLYSITPSKHLPEDLVAVIEDMPVQEQQVSIEAQVKALEEEAQATEASLRAKLIEEKQRIVAEAEALKGAGLSESTSYSVEEIYQGPGFDPGDGTMASAGGGIYDKLSDSQREQLNSIVSRLVEVLAKPVTSKVDGVVDGLYNKIDSALIKLEDKAMLTVSTQVDNIVGKVAGDIAAAMENDEIDISGAILEIGEITKTATKDEIEASLKAAIKENIRTPLEEVIVQGIAGRINNHIISKGSNIVYGMLSGDAGASGDAVKEILTELPGILEEIGKDIWDEVQPSNLASTVESLANDFVMGIDVNNIGSQISSQSGDVLKDLANEYLTDKATEAIAGVLNDNLDFGGDTAVPIDFVGIGSKIVSGGSAKDVFASDPVPLQLNTPFVELKGFVTFIQGDPTYGDVWAGDILMNIKVPDPNKPVQLAALYFNGKTAETNYWFCQIDAGGEDAGTRAPGDPISKEVRALATPVNLGIASLAGITGRVYHHMIEMPGERIVPDASINYGAYLGVVLLDGGGGSLLRLYVTGEVITKTNGDWTLDFYGNLHIKGANSVERGDPNAVMQGEVIVRYNSAEKHFFGYAGVDIKTSAICAGGSLLVDVKPGQWRIAFGTKRDRLYMTPGCVAWGVTGWLDVNQNSAEFGAGLTYSIYAKSPTVNIGIAKFYVAVDAGIAAGILAEVQYNPSFKLMKAGIFVEIWANIDLAYKQTFKDWKNVNLVSILIYGEMLMIFDPKPTTLEGMVDGYVSVLGFKKSFNASLKATM